jgi:hypothetical protein
MADKQDIFRRENEMQIIKTQKRLHADVSTSVESRENFHQMSQFEVMKRNCRGYEPRSAIQSPYFETNEDVSLWRL